MEAEDLDPKQKQVRLDPEIHAAMKEIADGDGKILYRLIGEVLAEYIAKRTGKRL